MSAATLARLAAGLEVSVDYFFESLKRLELVAGGR
jgi:hypothetical protein